MLTETREEFEIRIPNKEISMEFHEELEPFCTNIYRIHFDLLKECASIFNKLDDSDDQKNEEYISKLFDDLNKLFQTMNVDISQQTKFSVFVANH